MEPKEEIVTQAFEEKPLLAFSIYSQGQFDALRRMRSKLKALCPLLNNENFIRAEDFREYYDLFWFWTLGAYEILRTMASYPDCFSDEAFERIQQLKVLVAELRMPFAKQELRGKKRNEPNRFYAENSVVDVSNGLIFKINDKLIDSEQFADQIVAGIEGIKLTDIRKRMPVGTL